MFQGKMCYWKKYKIALISSLVFCFFVTVFFSSCDFNLEEEIDTQDFSVTVANKDYDFYIFNIFKNEQEDFENLLKEYESETGVKIKSFPCSSSTRDYVNALRTQLNSENKPAIFFVRNNFEFLPLQKEDQLLDFASYDQDSKVIQDFFQKFENSLKLTNDNSANYGIPVGVDFSGYLVNTTVLESLFNGQNVEDFIDNFKKSSFEEFENFVINLSSYIKVPENMQVSLNKKTYNLPEKKNGKLSNLIGVFLLDSQRNDAIDTVASVCYNSPVEVFKSDLKELKNALISYVKTLSLEIRHAYAAKQSSSFTDKINRDFILKEFLENKSLFLKGTSEDIKFLKKISEQESKNIRILPIKAPIAVDDIKISEFTPAKFNSNLKAYVSFYYCVNSKVSKKEQKLAVEFLHWLCVSDIGKKFTVKKLGKSYFEPNGVLKLEDFPLLKSYKSPENVLYTTNLESSEVFVDNVRTSEINTYLKKENLTKEDFEQISNIWINCFKNSKK
ncbi:MAG: extracellular solute-binding protein [Oscillospiraceae bacterium]|jgi:raffinose/stachyose/melibiose transport system substrate-binding protein|nr:extracellular solute-binding protein [Oscillospiraceae bacterium]